MFHLEIESPAMGWMTFGTYKTADEAHSASAQWRQKHDCRKMPFRVTEQAEVIAKKLGAPDHASDSPAR